MRKWRRLFLFSLACLSGILLLVLGIGFFLRPTSPFSQAVPQADHVELCLLDPGLHDLLEKSSPELPAQDFFPIKPYGTAKARIIKRMVLTGSDLKKVSGAFLDATRPGHTQAMCHLPIYGLRFFRGDHLVVETSICFHCNNFYVPLTAGGYSWEALSDFSHSLRPVLESFIPIPKDLNQEMDRQVGKKP
jgi:hypothetical protein